ncbi:dioxygenase family protein [Ketobacter sp.]|nr:MAG: dioxygenase [Ketobacter sp.]
MNGNEKNSLLTRRHVLKASVVSTAAAATMPALAFNLNPDGPTTPEPTCGTLTVNQTEGPYFTPGSPQKTNIREAGYEGTLLVVRGKVMAGCDPVANALLDFWQADGDGEYDNEGYRFRGHQYTNAEGVFYLETIVPGLYPGRTRHIHVKVQKPNGRVLTTQLYFPWESGNSRDFIYDSTLLLEISEEEGVQVGEIDFVLA